MGNVGWRLVTIALVWAALVECPLHGQSPEATSGNVPGSECAEGCRSEQVTVAELNQVLAERTGRHDAELAARLGKMELTERLGSSQLPALLAGLPGDKSRAALVALADLSLFANPPASETPPTPAPDDVAQRAMMARVVDYVARINHKLPDFFATRKTSRYEDWPQGLLYKGAIAGRYIPPQLVGSSQNTITYRNGEEVVEKGTSKYRKQVTNERGLYSWGLFGPVLATVLVDASKSSSSWSRWEQDGDRQLAVFRYSVPMEISTYHVKFCCYFSGPMLVPVDRNSAYHGEITVDPETGTILRLSLIADLGAGDLATMLNEFAAGNPLSRADMIVEYGPVEIGAKTYICPVRSVAISKARVPMIFRTRRLSASQKDKVPLDTDQPSQTIDLKSEDVTTELGPSRTYINHMVFSDYHVFRSESRILLDSSQ